MRLTEILKIDRIISELKSSTKDGVINELIDQFVDDDRVVDIEKVRNSVMEREKIMSTGVGKGFAIPHAKTDGVKGLIAGFGKISGSIDFQSLDEQPVDIIFLLVAQDNLVGPHIKLLSRISRMMNKDDFRSNLREAKTSEEIYEIFLEEEKSFPE